MIKKHSISVKQWVSHVRISKQLEPLFKTDLEHSKGTGQELAVPLEGILLEKKSTRGAFLHKIKLRLNEQNACVSSSSGRRSLIIKSRQRIKGCKSLYPIVDCSEHNQLLSGAWEDHPCQGGILAFLESSWSCRKLPGVLTMLGSGLHSRVYFRANLLPGLGGAMLSLANSSHCSSSVGLLFF